MVLEELGERIMLEAAFVQGAMQWAMGYSSNPKLMSTLTSSCVLRYALKSRYNLTHECHVESERRCMNPKQPKKMLIMDILDILRRRSDADHRLSLKDIVDWLERDFDMKADRKAVSRNIANLVDEGYPICHEEIKRTKRDAKTGESREFNIATNYYLEREFTEAELRLLIDGLIFSRHISPRQRKELIGKLENLSSMYFRSRMNHVHAMPKDRTDNKQIFYTIELLDEAIGKKRKVSFKYLSIGIDKKAHPRCRPDGTERIYVCTPYQMAVNEGKYYLICNYDKYEDITNYRIDRILDLEVLDEPGKPFASLKDAGGRALDLEKYMREHIHMYAGGTVRVEFRIVRRMAGDIIDIFGDGVRFFNETDSHVHVEAYVNEEAMVRFGRSNAPDVVILSPRRLADEIGRQLHAAAQAYEKKGVMQ